MAAIMTKRDRLENIVDSFGRSNPTLQAFFNSCRVEMLNDAAVEELTRKLLAERHGRLRRALFPETQTEAA